MGEGTALGGTWRLGEEGIGRGDVRASSRFCKGDAERERGRDSGGCATVSLVLGPNQRKTGCGDL